MLKKSEIAMATGSDDDDRELLKAWRGGDAVAGNELLSRHFASVYLFFRNKVDTGHHDLVQRTFMGCVESRDRVPDGASFRAYLLGIAHKQLLRLLRKREREGRAMHREGHAPPPSVQSPSKVVAQRQEQKLLLRALRSLPLELQVTVELFYWEDLGIADVAAATDVAPGTVKSRLSRARELLRGFIARSAADPALQTSTLDGLDRWARSLRDALSDAPEATPGKDGDDSG